MDTSSIQSTSTSTNTSSLSNVTQQNLGKEDFLKLLVAQLANQDPLQPMENTEFVSQLAQYSSLEQLMGVNSNLNLIQAGQTGLNNSQVASLIGREVEAKGDTLQLTTQGPASINFDLSGPAKDVTVKITDQQGNLIRTLQVGSRGAGINAYQWDGKDEMGNYVAAGSYQLEISAKDVNGGAVTTSTRLKGIVSGITYDGGVPLLEIGTAKVRVGDVIGVRLPESGTK